VLDPANSKESEVRTQRAGNNCSLRKRMKAETRIESNDALLFRIGDDLKAMNSAELLARYRDGIANHAAKTREQSQDDPTGRHAEVHLQKLQPA